MKFLMFSFVFVLLSLSFAELAYSEEESDAIEELFTQEEALVDGSAKKLGPDMSEPESNSISDLGRLSEFSDVAVIQRRFLPRTGRLEAFAGPTFSLNDAFFSNMGLSARLAYYFRERFGVELSGHYLTTAERSVTKDLRDRSVTTTSLVTPKSYLGVDFKWTPIYGKMTWMNRKITPFDLYFSIGGGSTGTNQGESAPTLHIGTGQVFALSKAMALRWDFSWNMFSLKSSLSSDSESTLYNHLFLMFGASFFFPEASYR